MAIQRSFDFIGQLLSSMRSGMRSAPQAAQIVAAECVVDAETKDHANWQLIGALAETLTGTPKKTLTGAYEQVEDEEDENPYHTKGWCRELWLDSLGLPADMPPPEEKKEVKSATDAARAAEQRKPNIKHAASGGRRPQPRA